MADQMQLDAVEAIGDRSRPTTTRKDLVNFFTRRNAQLQHKKHKLLNRWASVTVVSTHPTLPLSDF